MALKKALVYLVLAVVAFLVVSTVLSIIATILGLVWALVTTLATVLVVGALLYGAYALYSWLGDDDASATAGSEFDLGSSLNTGGSQRSADGGVDRIREQYADGKISEAELERRLERELDGGADGIDRELDRSRN